MMEEKKEGKKNIKVKTKESKKVEIDLIERARMVRFKNGTPAEQEMNADENKGQKGSNKSNNND
jgi:hypothetical protein